MESFRRQCIEKLKGEQTEMWFIHLFTYLIVYLKKLFKNLFNYIYHTIITIMVITNKYINNNNSDIRNERIYVH